ncbi:hypothetical protein HBI56_085560 [Parastagonospora nodorum]|nr:hypothetical protein HBH52_123470 [Parastagonospora nodorum]KAH3978605.1 hypothetical protein HBH51_060410 [Parastagonospora nodorum]KAH4032666.1 hypothetical protein HBI09_121820 [Parastagonospora nodorum]KAH4049062.1 hypothetical protein HBH49_141860 [Parastagonospora nodorum]KAH4067945.1 hypothetical protein HBH50_134050 [Parastagonospora nodorum]
MGFRALFFGKASASAINLDLQKVPQAEHSEARVAHKRSKSDRLFSVILKALHAHNGELDAQPIAATTAQPTATTTSPALLPTEIYRFQSPAGRNQPGSDAGVLSPFPTAESGCSFAGADQDYNKSTISASPITSPTTTPFGSSPIDVKQRNIISTDSTSPSSPPTTADSGCSPIASADTPPTTPGPSMSKDGKCWPHETSSATEYESALDGMRDAAEILARRHAVIKKKDEKEIARKKSFTNVLTKKRLRSPKSSPKDGPTNSAQGSPRVAKLPAHVAHSSYPQRKHAETAQDACDALQRRRILQHLSYQGAGGCEEAITALEELNAHYMLQARHQGTINGIPDLILNFDGIHIRASKLGTAEQTWVSRFNAVRKLQLLADRKQLGQEDFEHIGDQLFPGDADHILKPEHFEIFVIGLGLEGIITVAEAKRIADLQPSIQEYEAGARWTGKQSESQQQKGDNISTLAIFDIPKEVKRSAATYSAHPLTSKKTDLYYFLRILVEAAVYDQKFWKGYFFPNARSRVKSFFQASLAQQQGLPITPNLSDYTRPWTYRERRLLERGQIICSLLDSFDNGSLTDFGIIRAVRSSFIRLPGQGYWDAEELSTYLYHRVVDSGLKLSMIPDILALHHDYDTAAQKAGSRMQIIKELEQQMRQFKEEEEQRLGEIEASLETFAEMKKKELGRWQRFKKSLKNVFGKEQVVAPFDPFAEV